MISAILVGLAVYYYGKQLHTYQNIFYSLALILTILGYILEIKPIVNGEFAMGLWLLVIFAGALNPKWKITRQLRMVRKELSIIGFLLIVSHGLFYFIEGDFEIAGIIAIVLMFPLTVISFNIIRKKMTNKLWKNIQKIAYLIYALVFIHLIVVGEFIYLSVAIVYLYLKIKNILSKHTTFIKSKESIV